MDLGEFLRQTQADVRSQVADRIGVHDGDYPYAESVFAEVVMEHMSEIGMTFEPEVCHYTAKLGNATVRLSGFAVSDDADRLDLFVSLYAEADEVVHIPDAETKKAAEQCLRFVSRAADGRLIDAMEPSSDAHSLALTIRESYNQLEEIRIYVLTDRRAKAKNFQAREIRGRTIKLEVMDVERLHRHWSEGKPRDEITADFAQLTGGPLPCIYVPGESNDYDYAMTVLPGEALRFLYDKYGDRLLEANVRSFLSVTGKVNKGIRDTLKTQPGRFVAYNNGIVIVADEVRLDRMPDGGSGIVWMKGLQIVNGGQTTASLYFTKRKSPGDVDLSPVRIPAKVVVIKHSTDPAIEEEFIANISRCANSQNNVRQSDLSANKPFHREVETLLSTTYCPDGVGRWFYERAAGSYKTTLAREGSTPARLKKLKQAMPPSRKITKTDLAKYLNAWEGLPHFVSLGTQKNFAKFMQRLSTADGAREQPLDVTEVKRMIAKAILYRSVQKGIRGMFPAFQANVVAYTVSVVAHHLGSRLDLDRIWLDQGISPGLRTQIIKWAREVHAMLNRTAKGRMISEWAKKEECWHAVRNGTSPPTLRNLPALTIMQRG